MDDNKINLLEKFNQEKFAKREKEIKRAKRIKSQSKIKKNFLILLIGLAIFCFSGFFSSRQSSDEIFGFLPTIGFSKIFSAVKGYLSSDNTTLKGMSDDRLNILLMGVGGPGHDGPYLTDTIILVGFQPSTQKVALISIPRDLYLPVPGYGWTRVNNVNAYGEAKEKGGGGVLMEKALGDVLNIPIHYYLTIDFKAFEQVVDNLGGINVYVDNAFTDNQYPDDKLGFQPVSFAAGDQKMDGASALKFVRSRHGTNGESSDFARSKRQQKVLLAIKKKAFSFSTFINPGKITNIIDVIAKNMQTDLSTDEIMKIIKIAADFETKNIYTYSFTEDENSLLMADMTIDGAFILRPQTGNFHEMANFVNNIFANKKVITAEDLDKEKQRTEDYKKIKLLILNGTKIDGLARQAADESGILGFTVSAIGNAPEQNYEKSVIYDLTEQSKNGLTLLREKFQANVGETVPDFLKTAIPEGMSFDFIIVLGKNKI